MAALICVAGPLTVAIGPVPLSLASFAVYLAGAILGWKRGSLAVAVYLLIGLAGVPVFSGFSGGVQKLFGVTGGYLIGYVACALITGLFSGEPRVKKPRPAWMMAAGMVLGTAVLYAVGTAWFMAQTGNALAAALGMCVLPFLAGDAVKIAAASVIAVPVRRTLYR
ncbi:MAG: biotin transporter BioY [Clostridia bacterium]|nr:biotin transporter BioY [Clostridia bacterium]